MPEISDKDFVQKTVGCNQCGVKAGEPCRGVFREKQGVYRVRKALHLSRWQQLNMSPGEGRLVYDD